MSTLQQLESQMDKNLKKVDALIAHRNELLEVCRMWIHNEKCTCDPKDGGRDCPWCFTEEVVFKVKGGES